MVRFLRKPSETPAGQCIPLYIEGLDEHIRGGIPPGHITLVSGPSGTMKSSLCFNILYNEALRGKNSLYITLEQNHDSLFAHIQSLGYDLSKVNIVRVSQNTELNSQLAQLNSSRSTIVITDLSVLRVGSRKSRELSAASDTNLMSMIYTFVTRLREQNCSLFVLDSMSAFYIISKFESPREDLFNFFSFLRQSGVTSFLISEMPLSRDRYGEYEVEDFLADGIIKLDLVERQRKVTREISVVKMRSVKTSLDVFSLEFSDGRFMALYGGQPPLI